MAISNSIGSNVFDILVGLGLPWALQTLCIDYGSIVSASLSAAVTGVSGLGPECLFVAVYHLTCVSVCPLRSISTAED